LLQEILVEVHTILLVVAVVAVEYLLLIQPQQVELEVLLEVLQLPQVAEEQVEQLQERRELLEQQVHLLLVEQAVVVVEQTVQVLVAQEAQEASPEEEVGAAEVAHPRAGQVETAAAVVW